MIAIDAHRTTLDHVLALVANSDWGAGMVLRGSMTLHAWVGHQARPPGDLDWIIPEPQLCDPLEPFPYIDSIESVQQWPEAAAGAARYQIWTAEDFDTFGLHPKLPPEGLRWIHTDEYERPSLKDELIETIAQDPHASDDVMLDADGVHTDEHWPYFDDYDSTGTRLIVPWHSKRHGSGQVQLDFAVDQSLPDPPVWTAIPRTDGRLPTPILTATRELSLAWKLLWLHTDSAQARSAEGKDLYDAVILAECPQTNLTPRLLRTILGTNVRDFTPTAVRDWRVDWTKFLDTHPDIHGDLGDWLDRLVRAIPTPTIRKEHS
ncbi:nucleotidyl transferase AbiEii/AbiGii toxin family protein [Nocardia jejuensis]|uniref:nucleotidyl transferase AbiEii/AbiGii toxin family protein n=1 Tax=Nocardia jejuensis TaxID=328049 RepID=UPI0008307D0F|nr:nucleotidyl transferase AbiEii/AbiGii toxin family protein [Nocardia jejuensis]